MEKSTKVNAIPSFYRDDHTCCYFTTENLNDDGNDNIDDGTVEMCISSTERASASNQPMSLECKQTSLPEVKRTMSFEKLEIEFAKTTEKIKQALCRNNIDVHALIRQLSTISAVKDQDVPLLDEDVFQRVNTIDELWNILRKYWTMYNYDILTSIVDMAECSEATNIYEGFMSQIDCASLKGAPSDTILKCEVYERQGSKPELRVKIREKECTMKVETRVKKVLGKKYNLKDYALNLKGIKEGCFELIYEISNALEAYLLQCNLTEDDFAEFAALNIISIQIGGTKVTIPSEFGNPVCI